LDYNDNRGLPNWASWDLTTNDIGSSGRSNFSQDTNLPPNFYRVGTGEYSGSGYDRGHLCPSADRTITTNYNDLVFLMSNMMPQTSDNNSGVWGNFEGYCRSLCQSTNNYELLIICGPSGFTGAKVNTNGYVWIPQYTWKIVVVLPPGTNSATNRITSTNRIIAIRVVQLKPTGQNTSWLLLQEANFQKYCRNIELIYKGLLVLAALDSGCPTLPANVEAYETEKTDSLTLSHQTDPAIRSGQARQTSQRPA
jgi:DNA/RNA endonuclease G (NUC1)